MVTAYDAPSARAVDAAGVDMILVGDSVAMVVLGYDDTLHVTIDDMAHHTGAVARTKPRALVVADLPWMSYHLVARRHRRQRGAARARRRRRAVKLEGGRKRVDAVQRDPRRRDPGDGPPRPHARSRSTRSAASSVQGKTLDAAREIVDDAVALAEAGVFAIVLECVPDAVARMVTDSVPVPTIGIGAGRHCDGQVLVYHDILGFEDRVRPKFVRRYADLGGDAARAIERFADDVRAGRFPASGETYHAADTVSEALGLYGSVEHAPA